MKIRIVKVPEGEAPLGVREQWRDVEMEAMPTPTRRMSLPILPTEKYEEVGLVSGRCTFLRRFFGIRRHGFSVWLSDAISALEAKGTAEARQAAEWFRNNVPQDIKLLSFGRREAKIIG
jgi:hypothetical protein